MRTHTTNKGHGVYHVVREDRRGFVVMRFNKAQGWAIVESHPEHPIVLEGEWPTVKAAAEHIASLPEEAHT